jgi:hypothetical protein
MSDIEFTYTGDLGGSYDLRHLYGRQYYGFESVSRLLKVVRRDVKILEKEQSVLDININYDVENDKFGATLTYEVL